MADTETTIAAPVEGIAFSDASPLSGEAAIPCGSNAPDGDSEDEAPSATPTPPQTGESKSNTPPPINSNENPAEFCGWRPRGRPIPPTVAKPPPPPPPPKPTKSSKGFDTEGGVM